MVLELAVSVTIDSAASELLVAAAVANPIAHSARLWRAAIGSERLGRVARLAAASRRPQDSFSRSPFHTVHCNKQHGATTVGLTQ